MAESTATAPAKDLYDVVIVGGGAAGLGAALTLARARRSVLIIDSGEARNAPAGHVHNYLGREGTPPDELYAIGREEVVGYGAEIIPGTVTTAHKEDDGGFRVGIDGGRSARGRRLLVTTGLVDGLPAIEGLADRWGRDVLHCPYCHGWEVCDQAIGVIALNIGPAMHQALLWRQWTDDVTLFLHTAEAPSSEQREQLEARGITVVTGEVAAVEADADVLTGVRLKSGEVIARQAVAVMTRMDARAGFLDDLGMETAEQNFGDLVVGTFVASEPTGATSVPGVYVAGNVTNLMAQVIVAAAAGVNTGAMINADLMMEDTRLAVEARAVSV
ncbi:NAD(P)/FAD-dependent oxidoreductase [Arthrobacter crystallopoietes]|uniref:NAD(P)/FAD-dependent oxidoreductase n=1 Tax=Crystallibacter crystallopoietes TaxID=37928 RepID=UPI0011115282|nr:NAD(P)/FAD-dependent oxidoreductase [Arthrobacter crystallopoietes]QTG82151.1 NAD(P)/FAD-dependent oxidoreductase [Arthrobacter crystallopoietes]